MTEFRAIAWEGEPLFQFHDFDHWCDTAKVQFFRHGVRGDQCLLIDARGRVVTRGREFERARVDGTFPVKVYLVSPP